MVQSLKSQLEHALVKRPETYSEGKGSTSIENATSDGEDDSEVSSDIPNTTEVQGCQRDFGRD